MDKARFGFTIVRNTIIFCVASVFSSSGQQRPITIQVDATKAIGEMRPVWSYFGYDTLRQKRINV
jgi:hypothetical protein